MATRDMSGQGGPDNKSTGPLGQAQDDATEAGRQGVGAAQNRIRAAFEQQSHRAADQIGSVAHALHSAAKQLEEENKGAAARYTVMAADRVEQLADTLRNSSVDDLVGQVEGFARRQPEIFLGAAFGLGFLFARFVKSSGDRIRMADLTRRQSMGGQMGGGQMGGGMGRGQRGGGTYDFSKERQNIGGSYPASGQAPGTAGDRNRSRPSSPSASGTSGTGTGMGMGMGTGTGAGMGGGTTSASGSGVRDAAELMAGGSPEPIKNETARGEPAKSDPKKAEPVTGASTPAATMGATPGGTANPQERKP